MKREVVITLCDACKADGVRTELPVENVTQTLTIGRSQHMFDLCPQHLGEFAMSMARWQSIGLKVKRVYTRKAAA